MPATIENYVQPRSLYRYRSVKEDRLLNRELDAIQNHHLYCSAYTELNDPMEGSFSSSKLVRKSERYRQVKAAIIDNKAQIGICSFTEVYDHELMWAHYADRFA